MRPLFTFLVLTLAACDASRKTNLQPGPPPLATTLGVPLTYSVVRKWVIPNGGQGEDIVISPELATEEGMTALAKKVWYDTQTDRNAFVWIYDDPRAAQMARGIMSEHDKAKLAIYDRHFVGTYMRNINTGFHHMDMHPKGLQGPTIGIDL